MTREPDDQTDDRTDDPVEGAEDAADDREALARRLSEVLGDDASPGEGHPEAAEGGHRLRLDKTGALADRPKLLPRKAYPPRPDGPAPTGAQEGAARPEGGESGPRRAVLPPVLGSLRPPELDETLRGPPDDEVGISGGAFLYGEGGGERQLPPFRIDRFPVTNARYRVFVRATEHRPPLYWPGGQMPEELADHPVVGVDYFDALAYARWRGKDLPYEDEWERAARGTDGRTYPWGSDPELGEANTARLGTKMTLPVGWHDRNVSPDGVHDTVGNVWELTHSPAPGGGVVVRGGSWYDFALYAKTWFRFASRPAARNGTIGFRCVRRERERPDAPREVPPEVAEAEMAARRGAAPAVDPSTFSAERRDLVPDYRVLRRLVAEREEDRSPTPQGPGPVAVPAGASAREPRRAPRKAVPPPVLVRTPAPEPPRRKEEAAPAREAPPAPPSPVRAPAAGPSARTAPLPRGERPSAAAAPTGTAGGHEAPPLLFWGVVGAALALVATLLVLLLTGVFGGRGGESAETVRVPPGNPPEVSRADPTALSPLAGLPPAPPPGEAQDVPPHWVDGGEAGWQVRLDHGVRLLVFADGPRSRVQSSLDAASSLWRRLEKTEVEVWLVLPRADFAAPDGKLLPEADRVRRLESLKGRGDLTVFLDPAVGPPLGGMLRTRYSVREGIYAVVVDDGRIDSGTSPLGGAFAVETLAPLARLAIELTNPNR